MNYPLLDKYPLPFLPLIRAAAARGSSSSSLLYFIDSSSSGWWLLCRCGCCWLTTFLDFEHDSPQTIENEMPIYLSMLVHANRGIIIFYPNYVYLLQFCTKYEVSFMKKYRVGLEDSGGGRPFYRFIV